MGFTVYYRSLVPVGAEERAVIEAACDELGRGHEWLSCEPVSFFRDDDDGHLLGGSKPIFAPNAGEVASAESDGLPDGTIHDVLEILCQVSRTYDIDWEISHDYFEGAIGLIQGGQADAEVVQQLAALGELGDIVTEFGLPDAPGEPSDVDDDEPGLRLFQGDA